ncbi:tripartite motif-containing protein 16-like protein [Pseudochaenichthys georgianus]|uniref:tripartite motif-containing protein 16-like protein n=1 Tax=Pseudochaenichthys georgianus TaxID=52239 RepID=UPI00146A5D38|nr:tripartite motif-containing protein 16-like protein [Pseudochaenichthys georgianus]
MSQKGAQLDLDSISCSICLDVMKDPVTIPCGHSYCMGCITNYWDGETQNKKESCPQCRKAFTPRPDLVKDTMLAFLVERLKKTGLLDVERTETQKELTVSRQNIQKRIQDREKYVKLLEEEEKAINCSANKAVEHSEHKYSELLTAMVSRRSIMKQRIRVQQETERNRVRAFQEKLETEISELKSRDGELKQLSQEEDLNQLQQTYDSLPPLSGSTDTSCLTPRALGYFDGVTASVTKYLNTFLDLVKEEVYVVSLALGEVDMLLLKPVPRSRAEFIQLSRVVTLDPNTANRRLLLSEGNRKATATRRQQMYSRHPDRFDVHTQALSAEALTGRCYLEIVWKGFQVCFSLAYKSTQRKGPQDLAAFGHSDKSWSLHCGTIYFALWHKGESTAVAGPLSPRIGVYLDHSAGVLIYYSIVGGQMIPVHKVQTTFTEPLYAGVGLHYTLAECIEFIKLDEGRW